MMKPAHALAEEPRQLLWSDELGSSLLSSLANEVLLRHGAALRDRRDAPGDGSAVHVRRDLLAAARHDALIRRQIVTAWREAHPDAVAAADHTATEGLTAAGVRLLDAFPPEDILLALLTDEFEDGLELAQRFVSCVAADSDRRDLLTVLQRLTGEGRTAPQRFRVVIVGGHPRDESRLRSLFENSPFEVRWHSFEKKQGGGALERTVIAVLRHADAAVIVTGMASHGLMHHARDYAQRCGIRWKCIHKATAQQLQVALKELFPMLTWDRSP